MRTITPINRPPLPVTLIEYGDYSCTRCRELQQLLATTLPQFEGAICYTFRHFPNLSYPPAFLMALAAEAARQQNQYWAMHQALFAQTNLPPASLDSVSALAAELGLERKAFLTDMRNESLKQRIWADMEQGRLAGVMSTPTLFMGTRRLHGKLTQARLIPILRHYVGRSTASVFTTVDGDNGLVRWSGVGYP